MKKVLFLVIVLFSINTITNAQAWDGKGDTKVSAGYEFYGFSIIDNIGNTENAVVSTIDYGISDNISVGTGVKYNFNSTNLYVNLRADYHFQHIFELSSNFDIYVGADIGLNTVYKQEWDMGLHIGTRFMFTDVVGIYFEIGNSGIAGLSYNF